MELDWGHARRSWSCSHSSVWDGLVFKRAGETFTFLHTQIFSRDLSKYFQRFRVFFCDDKERCSVSPLFDMVCFLLQINTALLVLEEVGRYLVMKRSPFVVERQLEPNTAVGGFPGSG